MPDSTAELPEPRGSFGGLDTIFSIQSGAADRLLARESQALEALSSMGEQSRQVGERATSSDVLRVVEGVAYIEICGVMRRDPSAFDLFFADSLPPFVGMGDWTAAVARAISDESVHTLLTHIRTPGGVTDGLAELTDVIYDARQSGMRTIAFGDHAVYSAGYRVASQHAEIYIGRDTGVGSIGTFATLFDSSQWEESMGFKTLVLKSTDLKGGTVSGVKISDEVLAEFQRLVDSSNEIFVDDVARGRGVDRAVAEGWADARMHIGRQAVDLGLVNGVSRLQDVWSAAIRREAVGQSSAFQELAPPETSRQLAKVPLQVGGEERMVDARPLAQPVGDATHWAVHPETGDPVMVAFSADPKRPSETTEAPEAPDQQALTQQVMDSLVRKLNERTGSF